MAFVVQEEKRAWKHICVKNTEVLTPGLFLTQRLSVSQLLCTAVQGWEALLSLLLVWDCSFKAPMNYEKVNRENKMSSCTKA